MSLPFLPLPLPQGGPLECHQGFQFHLPPSPPLLPSKLIPTPLLSSRKPPSFKPPSPSSPFNPPPPHPLLNPPSSLSLSLSIPLPFTWRSPGCLRGLKPPVPLPSLPLLTPRLPLGSDLFGPNRFRPTRRRRVGPRTVRPRRVEASQGGSPNIENAGVRRVEPRRVEPQRVGGPKFRALFSLSRHGGLPGFSPGVSLGVSPRCLLGGSGRSPGWGSPEGLRVFKLRLTPSSFNPLLPLTTPLPFTPPPPFIFTKKEKGCYANSPLVLV